MLHPDHFGLNVERTTRHLRGGVAPSRHALRRQQYLEARKSCLDGETVERQWQKADAIAGAAATFFGRVVDGVRVILRRRKPAAGSK